MGQKAAWTIMVYMAGDNNLSDAGDADLIEMRRIGSTDQVQVVVEFDNAGSAGTRRIHVAEDGPHISPACVALVEHADCQQSVIFCVYLPHEQPS